MQLRIPEVKAFTKDVLLLVVLDSPYCNRVQITLGTLHTEILIKLVTLGELEKLSHCWKRGAASLELPCIECNW